MSDIPLINTTEPSAVPPTPPTPPITPIIPTVQVSPSVNETPSTVLSRLSNAVKEFEDYISTTKENVDTDYLKMLQEIKLLHTATKSLLYAGIIIVAFSLLKLVINT